MSRLLLFMVIFSLSGCAVRGPAAAAEPDLIQRARVISGQDRMAAIRMLEDEIGSGRADPSVVPWAMLWAGEQRRLSGDLVQARHWFGQLASRYPTHTLKDSGILGMALVDAQKSLSGNTLATIQLMGDRGVPDTMNADRYRLLARVGADEGSPRTKVAELANKALHYASADVSVTQRVNESLHDILTPEQSATPAEVLTGTAEDIAVAQARLALQEGRYDEAQKLAADAQKTWPASLFTQELKYIDLRAAAENKTIAGKVGVLLPLAGDYAPAGEQFKKVIEQVNIQSGSPLELVFANTDGTEDGTLEQLVDLVIEQGCVSVLGPLLKTNGEVAARHAQALQTPLVTLTQGGDPTAAGEFIFRGFMTLKQQVNALVTHAIEDNGHSRFAILHPNNGYGTAARDLFTNAVTQQGGEISNIVGYEIDTTDFRPIAQELGEKNSEERYAEFLEMQATARRRNMDRRKTMLPPKIDFDAIFIPDNHQRVVLVTSALAYEEFPVGSFRKNVQDIPIQMLGLNSWNHSRLVLNGGKYVRNSAFVDAFWVDSPDEAVRTFVSTFRESIGRSPRITDALVWDATRLLIAGVVEGGDDRDAIRVALSAVEIDDPVAGGKGFSENREVERTFHILTIKKSGGIQPWIPKPPTDIDELVLPEDEDTIPSENEVEPQLIE
jgi:branched-chain amino acid transport system substrate-binding protein